MTSQARLLCVILSSSSPSRVGRTARTEMRPKKWKSRRGRGRECYGDKGSGWYRGNEMNERGIKRGTALEKEGSKKEKGRR